MKLFSACFNCFASNTHDDHLVSGSTGGQIIETFEVFSYSQLKIATVGFSNKIGEGGFGTVFKGKLGDGTMVAVKVLSIEPESMRGEREFISEIAALSNIKHENLVTLRGCCVDGADRLLVYDLMENNSLAHTLLGSEENRSKFTWGARREISLGVARGLAYLHEEIQPPIVHRDIKASNILLDQNFIPKVSDFGLSKLFRENVSHISTRVAGTLGHLAPEYAISGRLTRKSDVYSFGVLLLEIISGRSVVDFDMENGEHYLVEKAWELYKANHPLQIMDPMLNGDFSEEEAIRILTVGLLCVQETTALRPKMSLAVDMLSTDTDLKDVTISKPGLLADLMDVKIGRRHYTHNNSSKGSISTTRSPQSSNYF